MPDLLEQKDRKARKPHTCNYCGEVIQKGEVYEWAKLCYDGQLYEWKNHKKCGFVSSALWSYIDPDEGMTDEDFSNGCFEFCREFICKDCQKFDADSEDCKDYLMYCVDKIYDFLQTHDFKKDSERPWIWKCFDKKKMEEKS